MACNCKHMAREIAEYKQQIHELRNCFIICSIGCKSKRKDVEELMNDKL